jgi:hypothetical protein
MRVTKKEIEVSFMGEILKMKIVDNPLGYMWATASDTAGLIRNLFKAKFGWKSGKDMWIRTEVFSMGNSINVTVSDEAWNRLDENMKEYVEAVKSSVKDGYWDGMYDTYRDTGRNRVKTLDGKEVQLSCKYYQLYIGNE